MPEPIPIKSLGQHWLTDELTLANMVTAADIAADDTVLEIGPGPGALTKLLVRAAGQGQVVAVEFDRLLAARLPQHVPAKNLRVVNQDILRFDLTSLPPDYKVSANIPYYLTSKLVRVLSETSNPPQQVALLIQKEVAERLAAEPGNLSILGVTAQFFWEISLGPVVAAELFTPAPKVDSQIVQMKRRNDPLSAIGAAENLDIREFFRVVKAGFGARRKTLLNSLSGGLHLSKAETTELLGRAGIGTGLRAQNLSLPDWYAVYKAYAS